MGYRLNIINSGFKVASLDMTVSNFKKLTEVFKPINPVMGFIIPAKPKYGVLLTDDEYNAFEVTSKKQALDLLDRFYYSIEDGLAQEAMAIDGSILGYARVSKYDLEELGCEGNEEIVDTLGVYNKASKGIICDIEVLDVDDSIAIYVQFNDMLELLKFAYSIIKMRIANYNSGRGFVSKSYTEFSMLGTVQLLNGSTRVINTRVDGRKAFNLVLSDIYNAIGVSNIRFARFRGTLCDSLSVGFDNRCMYIKDTFSVSD